VIESRRSAGIGAGGGIDGIAIGAAPLGAGIDCGGSEAGATDGFTTTALGGGGGATDGFTTTALGGGGGATDGFTTTALGGGGGTLRIDGGGGADDFVAIGATAMPTMSSSSRSSVAARSRIGAGGAEAFARFGRGMAGRTLALMGT
jgi:hypothetical protein